VLTFDQIKELLELVAARQLHGLEIERAGFRLKIEGTAPVATATAPNAVVSAPQAASSTAPAAASAPAAAPTPTAAAGPALGTHMLTSPIVGTFYRSPSPDAESFVEVGSRVRKGQVLCIIEAMKLMNEIEADVEGVVTEVFPQNAQAVEFGEPLFAIRTA
jgi:acetyl-CoA carboxylase biotin carboxyl carrier protein